MFGIITPLVIIFGTIEEIKFLFRNQDDEDSCDRGCTWTIHEV